MAEITVQQVIQTAIRAEELGINYYSELAKRFSKYEDLRHILEQLAKDEVEHKRQFSEMLRNVGNDKFDIKEEDAEFMRGVDISKFFDGMETVGANVKPIAVLARAYAFEKESVLFYLGLRDIMGKNAQLDEIIRIEKSHVTKLMQYVLEDSNFRGISDEWI